MQSRMSLNVEHWLGSEERAIWRNVGSTTRFASMEEGERRWINGTKGNQITKPSLF